MLLTIIVDTLYKLYNRLNYLTPHLLIPFPFENSEKREISSK